MSGPTIAAVQARRVWDSRGLPTVEVEIRLQNGVVGRAIAPAGASTGTREAVDLRDRGRRLAGKDVRQACAAVDGPIAAALVGRDINDQRAIDTTLIALDGTPQKRRLGGNATVATSLAALHAAAHAREQPLWSHLAKNHRRTPTVPLPEIQIFGGGAHAGARVDIQDFMIMAPGAASFDQAMQITAEVYHAAGDLLAAKGRRFGVADEGGWWPDFDRNEQALELLVAAIERAGEKPGRNVVISLDVAASEFYCDGQYRLALEDRRLDTGQMIDLLGGWLEDYPIVSIEDPLAENDAAGMAEFTRRYGQRVQVVGDDYLATNCALVEQAAAARSCNAALIKVNQAGTVSEAVDAMQAAEAAGWQTIVSARSGESEDISVAHLAVGLGAGQLKVGSFSRSERMAKWNACLRVEEHLGAKAFVRGGPLANTWWSGA